MKRILVNMESNGIGDVLLGLTSVAGLRASTDDRIIYQVPCHRVEWAKLFSDPHEIVSASVPMDVYFHPYSTYHLELVTRSIEPRYEAYAHHCKTDPVLPTPVSIPVDDKHKDCVILVPFCDWAARCWPMKYWLALERLLIDAGEKCLILDAPGDGKRTAPFKSIRYWGHPASKVASLIMGSRAVVGGDTGMIHLAGCLRKKAVAICGPTNGQQIYGIYPDVISLRGSLGCGGCYWRGPDWLPACSGGCADLTSILPSQVFEALGAKTIF